MLDIVKLTLDASGLVAGLAAGVLGGLVAYVSAWVCDVAEDLPENGALLPEIARALLCGGVQNRGRGGAVLFCTIACAAIPLIVGIPFLLLGLLIVIGVPAGVMDTRFHIIPEELTWGLLFSGALLSPWTNGSDDAILGALMASGAAWTAMMVVEYRTGQLTRSGGDIAVAAAGGAWVGMFSSGTYVFVACVVFAAYAAVARMRSDGQKWLPMGPALLVAIPIAPALKPLTDYLAVMAL